MLNMMRHKKQSKQIDMMVVLRNLKKEIQKNAEFVGKTLQKKQKLFTKGNQKKELFMVKQKQKT